MPTPYDHTYCSAPGKTMSRGCFRRQRCNIPVCEPPVEPPSRHISFNNSTTRPISYTCLQPAEHPLFYVTSIAVQSAGYITRVYLGACGILRITGYGRQAVSSRSTYALSQYTHCTTPAVVQPAHDKPPWLLNRGHLIISGLRPTLTTRPPLPANLLDTQSFQLHFLLRASASWRLVPKLRESTKVIDGVIEDVSDLLARLKHTTVRQAVASLSPGPMTALGVV